MGLDQFAYKTKVKPSKPVDFQEEVYGEDVKREEIHYWRKHPNVHGFMEEIYREKGGEHSFNCRPVELTQEDIDLLAQSILDGELPETSASSLANHLVTRRMMIWNFVKKQVKQLKKATQYSTIVGGKTSF